MMMLRRIGFLVLAASLALAGVVSSPAQAASAADSSASAVYRFWSPEFRSHFYTMSVAERDHIIATFPTNMWTYEKVAYGAYATQVPGTVPLYRFWSSAFHGHFYTTNEGEKDHVIDAYPDSTWLYEGIAFYVYPDSSTVTDTRPVARFWSPTFRHHFYTASAEEASLVKTTYPASIWTYENDNFRVPNAVPAEAPVPRTFGDGQYLIGSELPDGIYRTDGGPSCYWERQSGLGGTAGEIIANAFEPNMSQLVEISSTDKAFKSDDCGTWKSISLYQSAGPLSQFGDGMYLVDTDIVPGTYRATPTSSCYWERLSGLSGELKDVIASNFSSTSSQLVQVSATDVAVKSSGCGTWTRIA